jgi:AcrR family transcriptional regulator
MVAADRPPLSRERIAQVALEITAQDGLSALSMRKLGSELGVEAMSLYHYVASKDDLLDLMVDRLYDEIKLPSDLPADQWEQTFGQSLRSFYDLLLDHAAALELFTQRPASTTNAFRTLYWVYSRFQMIGLGPREASLAYRYAVSFVVGQAVIELGMGRFRTALPAVELDEPGMAEFIAHNLELSGDAMFEIGLDMVFQTVAVRFGLQRSMVRHV